VKAPPSAAAVCVAAIIRQHHPNVLPLKGARIKMQSERFKEFRVELASNIRKTICDLRDDGILAMSRNPLLQVTPSPKVARGPIGPNARWAYERIFDEVIEQLPRGYRRFVEHDCSIIAAAMGGVR
jgi:hypothetical protein